MKVEQEGTDFAPITITLETQEEANIMWAILNTPFDTSKGFAYHISLINKCEQQHYRMYKAFNEVYRG